MPHPEFDQRAATFVTDLTGPLGPKPLERVLSQHLGLFTDLRSAGASWRQIAALMAKHGVARKDGTTIAPEQWAAMVSRAQNRVTPRPVSRQHIEVIPHVVASFVPTPSRAAKTDTNMTKVSIRARMRASAHVRREDTE